MGTKLGIESALWDGGGFLGWGGGLIRKENLHSGQRIYIRLTE